ncbi:hypothetical protein KAZ66_02640 [Candidatus Woesebacteria bacterium]|nr:hypothetical protein [Candidatus Woesebacteria bacterium]
MKKRILFDPHGGHATTGCDDGRCDVASNVAAALEKNIIPSITGHNETSGWNDYLEAMAAHGKSHYSILGTEFGYVYKDPATKQRYKGEIICLLPAHEKLAKKMKNDVIDVWRAKKWYKKQPLTALIEHVRHNLTQNEFDQLVWHLPHPVTIDAVPVGKLIARVWGKFDILSSPEVYFPEIACIINTIEVYNAAHPGVTNRMSVDFAKDPRFSHVGWAGASDSHHACWLGSGATMLETMEESAEGILNAMKKGRTIALSGMGVMSNTVLPFLMWGLTIGFANTKVTDMIATKTNAHQALEKFQNKTFDELLVLSKQQGWLR